MMEQKMVIPFRTIIAINKESSTFGVLANSIAIHTKEKEEVLALYLYFICNLNIFCYIVFLLQLL